MHQWQEFLSSFSVLEFVLLGFLSFFYLTAFINLFFDILLSVKKFAVVFLHLLWRFNKKKPRSQPSFGQKLSIKLGCAEYHLVILRRLIVIPPLLVFLVFQFFTNKDAFSVLPNSFWLNFCLVLVGLEVYNAFLRRAVFVRLLEWLHTHPHLHPVDFFNAVYQCYGPLLPQFDSSQSARTLYPDNADFRDDLKSRYSFWIVLRLIRDTIFLSYLSLTALRAVGPRYAAKSFDLNALIWGKRFIQHLRIDFKAQNIEALKNLKGKNLLLFNHKSQLDFVLAFFALGRYPFANDRSLSIRFITAKDHFLDNFFIYEFFGVGKTIEAVGMIFLDRKSLKNSAVGLYEAAKAFTQRPIDLAIYPQGTRAFANQDRAGKRRDAGYYTTFSKKNIDDDLAHIRRGPAYLIADSLCELQKQSNPEPLNLIPIAIDGTATSAARSSMKFLLNNSVSFRVGKIISLKANEIAILEKPTQQKPQNQNQEAYVKLVKSLTPQIDQMLRTTLDLDQQLTAHYLSDLRGHFSYDLQKIDRLENEISRLKPDLKTVFYQTLDRIYALKVDLWNTYLAQVAHLLENNAGLDEWRSLRKKVSLLILKK